MGSEISEAFLRLAEEAKAMDDTPFANVPESGFMEDTRLPKTHDLGITLDRLCRLTSGPSGLFRDAAGHEQLLDGASSLVHFHFW